MKKLSRALLLVLVAAILWATALAATVKTTGNVWLRKGPGLGYSKITSVQSGTKLEYMGKTSTDDRGVKWYYVKYKGRKCWVSSRYSKLSGKSSSSSSDSSSATRKPSATNTPAPEELPETETIPNLDVNFINSENGAVEATPIPMDGTEATPTPEVPSFEAQPAPIELSPWYLMNLEETATALKLGKFQQDDTSDFKNTYSNEVLLIGGDTKTEHFHIVGEGYSVYGASVGMSMEDAVTALTAAGLARTDNILGASFQHYAEANAPVNVNGFDSFINLIADASGKVTEISWSIYTGDWTTAGSEQTEG